MNTKIIVGSNLVKNLSEILQELTPSSVICLIDQTILKLYGNILNSQFKKLDASTFVIPINSVEKSKTLNLDLISLINQIIEKDVNRKSVCLAIGGGVITDLGGFIGSILFRGIKTVYVPTTLLGMVDASLGGKTGVNVKHGEMLYKNMVGSFHQPTFVVCDTDFLATLPEKELKSGVGEILKYYIGWGGPKLSDIKSFLNNPKMDSIPLIEECQKIKMSIVNRDPFETTKEREKLNLGHTIGHGIEGEKNGAISHGVAVVWGLLGESHMSMLDGYLSQYEYEKIKKGILSLQLIESIAFSTSKVLKIIQKDKKNKTYVAIKKIGDIEAGVKINPINLEKSLNYLNGKENL